MCSSVILSGFLEEKTLSNWVLEVLIGLKQIVHYHSLDFPVPVGQSGVALLLGLMELQSGWFSGLGEVSPSTCSSLLGRAVVDSLDADLLALFGDGVLSTDVAPLVLGVGGLSLGVLSIPPPLLLVILMLRSIVDGC
jgi:hypothetical protein